MSTEPKPIMLDPIQIEPFEQLAYARKYEEAMQALFTIITQIKRGHGLAYFAASAPPIETLYTRIAAAISTIFADPTFALSHEGFLRLMNDHATLHGIFRASSFWSLDYVLGLVGTRNPENLSQLSFSGDMQVSKLLLCWSLDSDIDIDWNHMTNAIPAWACPAMLGILSIGGVHTEKAYNRKVEMLRHADYIDRGPMPLMIIPAAGDAYMHCSYVDDPVKHNIKRVINRQLRALVLSLITVNERHAVARKDRPTIVVPVEWFGSAHAMFRCYCPAIRQLRQRFNMVLIARESEVDEESKKEFDKVVLLPPERIAINEMVAAVQAEKPDIIFYPSLGMTAWWVAISNFRLAPIQIMCPGHPATSLSEAIDYIVSDGDLFGDERHYQEKCVHLPVGGARYLGREDFDASKVVRPGDGVVRFAIPAMVMKLAAPFLQTVKRIQDECQHIYPKVEFHFFPNQVSTGHILMERELERLVPGCKVHPRETYQDYMQLLGRCDVMLSTFPFGGTNSVMDSFLLGLPVVTLEGDQIHSRSDGSMIRRVGLPDWMIAHSEEEYVRAAVRMASSATDRQNASELLREIDVKAEFYGDGPPEVHGSFLKAFEKIYQEKLDEQQARGVFEGAGGASAGDRWGAHRRFTADLR